MGYYTIHVIRIINKYNTRKNIKLLRLVVEKISGYSFRQKGSFLFDSYGDGRKWYGCYGDMIKISRKLPDLEIQIFGKGEDEEDEWNHIFKNGEDISCGTKFIEPDDNSDYCEETESNDEFYSEDE